MRSIRWLPPHHQLLKICLYIIAGIPEQSLFYTDRRDFKPPVFTDSAVVCILPNFGMHLNRTVEFAVKTCIP